ncbi:amino acid ABC transporter permease [Demequina aestuarii]|uniref:amino acid ABC transporter permease n=1 Tax=Demequina aestuarii TaxID=327095 RepID=UPI000A06FCFE|nr:amino acid ABC transporter permease [Demequina aestuarii]
MSSQASVLYDIPGPKAKRRDVVYNIVFTAFFVSLLAYIIYAFNQRGIFDDRWSVLWDPPKGQTAADVWHALLVRGLGATMLATVIAAPLALALGGALSVLRRGLRNRLGSASATVVTEIFRGLPVLLMMVLARFGFGWSGLWSVVFGLVVYNMAVVAEILRAGLAALPAGQREAGLSVGLSTMRTTVLIEMPQAVRIMLPALVSQLVVLLKDSSLGYIIAYSELLRQIRTMREYFGDRYTIPVFLVGATVYILINILVSRLAIWLEGRMRSSGNVAKADEGEPPMPEGGAEAARLTATHGRGPGDLPRT